MITYDWYTPRGKTNISHIIYTSARKHNYDGKDTDPGKKYGEKGRVYECRDTVINNNIIEQSGFLKESTTGVSTYNMVLQKRPNN